MPMSCADHDPRLSSRVPVPGTTLGWPQPGHLIRFQPADAADNGADNHFLGQARCVDILQPLLARVAFDQSRVQIDKLPPCLLVQ